jgi:hypothetical protein
MKEQSAESSDLDADLVDDLDRALKLNQTVQQTAVASPIRIQQTATVSPIRTPSDQTQIYHDVIEN